MSKPMFAKRHYEAIATAMQRALPGADSPLIGGWHRVVNALAETFERDNELFKHNRFVIACLPGVDVRARS